MDKGDSGGSMGRPASSRAASRDTGFVIKSSDKFGPAWLYKERPTDIFS